MVGSAAEKCLCSCRHQLVILREFIQLKCQRAVLATKILAVYLFSFKLQAKVFHFSYFASVSHENASRSRQ